MKRISLVAFPFLIMLLSAIIGGVNYSANATVNPNIENVQPVNLPSLLSITVIIGVALGAAILVGIRVLGSGVSGSVAPIVFLCTILLSIFGLLSALSFNIITSIPVIGYPLYFSLIVCFCIGIASLGVASGGE